ncbi:MAG TPA: hypothetical protein VGD27_07500 [Longimicrobiales bacterium]
MLRKLLHSLVGPPPLDDPVFGRLVFKRRPIAGWHGETVFTPSGTKISLVIDANEAGPGDSQRQLYRKIESRWEDLRRAVSRELISFHNDVLEEEITDAWSIYRMSGVFLPRTESKRMNWELRFDSSKDRDHKYVVEFEGWEPTGEIRPEG